MSSLRGRLADGSQAYAPTALRVGLTAMLGIGGLLRSVLIVEVSMPNAIDALILSMHFNWRPELTATVVFLTTLLSLGALTLIPSVLN